MSDKLDGKQTAEMLTAFAAQCRAAFNATRDELTEAALQQGKLPAGAICVALTMAAINVAAMAIVGGNLIPEEFDDELKVAIAAKREAIADNARSGLQ